MSSFTVLRKRKKEEIDDEDAEMGVRESRVKQDKAAAEPQRGGMVHEIVETTGAATTHAPLSDAAAWRTFTPAKQYAFTLDPFQRAAVCAIERSENVLVSAHTSAGKTVVAEYAIALALKRGQHVIYTSPLKALSNQKYRELAAEFRDVGLLTGDVSVNPNALCLVMTTEVLRSMLYKGSDILGTVGWIVFDEIHYLRDRERGVAWEESIILCPRQARLVFLSATIPNAREFAQWVARTHGTRCNVISTEYRPTPLQHYAFPAGGDNLYLTVDEGGRYLESSFRKALNEMQHGTGKQGKKRKEDNGTKDAKAGKTGDIFKIVKMIMDRGFDPVIIFSFSKRDCETLALQTINMQLASDKEKKVIQGVFESAIDTLPEADRRLPQVTRLLPLLLRGVGIHHGGMLPIVKEITELLFQEGLLKVLFATETFSTGLNMPARTVVMTGIRKFDGVDFRVLTGGEYIQMSGRAGRRGLDDKGIVILMIEEKMEPDAAKNLLRGSSDPLNSAYHLTYHAMLNTMRAQSGFNPSNLVRASFLQFQAEHAIPLVQKRADDLAAKMRACVIDDEETVMDYFKRRQRLARHQLDLRESIHIPKLILKFLQPGRLVQVLPETQFASSLPGMDSEIEASDDVYLAQECPWAAVVDIQKLGSEFKRAGVKYMVDVLAPCARAGKNCYITEKDTSSFEVVSVPLIRLASLSTIRIYLPPDIRTPDSRKKAYAIVEQVKQRYPSGIQCLDIEEDLDVHDTHVRKLIRKTEQIEKSLTEHKFRENSQSNQEAIKAVYLEKMALKRDLKSAEKQIAEAGEVALKSELRSRQRILRRLNYIDKDGVVLMKGQLAAEISSGDEIVLTELLMDGTFVGMSPEHAAALLICTIPDQGGSSSGGGKRQALRAELERLHKIVRDVAKKVSAVAEECNLNINRDDYIDSFSPGMMEIIVMWVSGSSFGDLCKVTEDYEGSVVRAIRRLEELTRQLLAAATVLQEQTLMALFEKVIELIKRDIVFAPNLYL